MRTPAGRVAGCGARAAIARRGSWKAARARSRSPCTSSCAPIRSRTDMGDVPFDPMDPEFIVDPYPTYHRLRADDPVHHNPLGFWVLTRYDDVVAALRDPRL